MNQKIRTKKDTISVSIPPYLKAKLKELVDSGEFSSVSELITIAISEFIGKYESRKAEQKPPEDAQERIKNAVLLEERRGEVE